MVWYGKLTINKAKDNNNKDTFVEFGSTRKTKHLP